MHSILQSRLLRLLTLLLCSAVLLAACSQEPKQRAAFISFLQTRVINVKGPAIPLLSGTERSNLGEDYAKQYEVIQNFHQSMNQSMNGPARKAMSMGNLSSVNAIISRRGDLQSVRQALQQLRSTLDESLSKADSARASFQQPEDLRAVYDQAYAKTVSKPAHAFQQMFPLMDEVFASVDKVADYAEKHQGQLKMRGSMLEVTDEQVLKDINALIDETNQKAQAAMNAQNDFMKALNGG